MTALPYGLGVGVAIAGFTIAMTSRDWVTAGWAASSGCWAATSWLNRRAGRR